jgi:uncharacterized membrane-anchored protein
MNYSFKQTLTFQIADLGKGEITMKYELLEAIQNQNTDFWKLTRAFATSMAIWILFFHGSSRLPDAAKRRMLFCT